MKQGLSVLVVASMTFAAGCSTTVDRATLARAVEQSAVTVAPGDAPRFLAERLADHAVVMLGEAHYVAEHQELLAGLVAELAEGQPVQLLFEGIHAFGWIADDYVAGERSDLPPRLKMFSEVWLDAVRRFNLEQPGSQRIVCSAIDMNHRAEDFLVSMSLLEEKLGPLGVFDEVRSTTPGSAEYEETLARMEGRLSAEATGVGERLGGSWHQRLLDMVRVERASLQIRRNWSDAAREEIMIDHCRRRITDWDGITVINCGMNHAQKSQCLYGHELLLGPALRREFPDVFSVAFAPVRGERKARFFDEDTFETDLIAESRANDLVRLLAELAGEQMGYLALSGTVFERTARVNLGAGGRQVFAPAQAFDAVATHPRVSVVAGVRAYRVH